VIMQQSLARGVVYPLDRFVDATVLTWTENTHRQHVVTVVRRYSFVLDDISQFRESIFDLQDLL